MIARRCGRLWDLSGCSGHCFVLRYYEGQEGRGKRGKGEGEGTEASVRSLRAGA